MMVAVTYGVARVPAAKVGAKVGAKIGAKVATKAAGRALAAPRKTPFVRFMDALVESRLQAVHREIARHAHLLPRQFDERGNRLVGTDID
jgi:hypothetical protein